MVSLRLATRLAPRALLALVIVAVAAPVAAQQPAGWSLGVGAVGSGRPYGDAATDITPVPFIGYEGERFFLRGLAAGWRAPTPEPLEAALVVRARMQRFDASDDPVLQGMDTRRRTAEAGVVVRGGLRPVRLRAGVYQDLLGRHGGQVLELRASVPVPMGNWVVTPSVGADWQSARLTDYYYGVAEDEATPARPAYRPGASLDRTVGLGLGYRAGRRAQVTLQLERTFFGPTLRDSPIIDDSGRWSGFVGVSWRL